MVMTRPTAWLARDATLPHRDALLDEAAVPRMLRCLDPSGTADITGCHCTRVNYQVGKSVRAVFHVEIDRRPHVVAARMFRPGRTDAYHSMRLDTQPVDGLYTVAHAAAIDTTFWLFPHDRKIATLGSVTEPNEQVMSLVSKSWKTTRLAAYAPEKSATLACLDANHQPVAYAKIAASYQAERDHGTYLQLRSRLPARCTPLVLPAPLAYSSQLRTLWLEPLAGRRLVEPTHAAAAADLRRLGGAVAVFHDLRAPGVPRFDRFNPERLSAAVAILEHVRPDVAAPAERLVSRLADSARSARCDLVCLHGDLHPKNAIVIGDAVGLIDVEDVASGPSAADLGSLLAGLAYLHCAGDLSKARYVELAEAFLGGYARRRILPDHTSIAWHTAAALFLERAVRAVTRIRPLGLMHLSELIAEAERLLTESLEIA